LSILFLYVYLFQLRATYRCLLTVILYMCVNVSGAFSLRASTRHAYSWTSHRQCPSPGHK